MDLHLILGNSLSMLGIAAGAYYLITTRRMIVSPSAPAAIKKDLKTIFRRRRFGASLMILISVMFLIATNWFSQIHTLPMSIFWLILMILLLWLIVLAGLDILTTTRLRQELLHEAHEKFADIMGKKAQNKNDKKTTKDSDASDKESSNDDEKADQE